MGLIAKKDCMCASAAWRLQRMAQVVLENAETVRGIKAAVAAGDDVGGAQLWFELDGHEHIALWVAPSKGGIFTTEERTAIRRWEAQHYQESAA